jgi:nanoRNase/pAp phosphatase (c-di-AMP/oligoRNAs hydrolase)
VFTHRQADPDALCSAYVLTEIFSRLRKTAKKSQLSSNFTSKIVAPQGASVLGSKVCKALSIPFEEEISDSEIQGADLIAAVDLGERELLDPYLGQIQKSQARKILIDHHSSSSETKPSSETEVELFDEKFVNPSATSTCEIISLGFAQKLLDQRLSKLLLVGLLYDSQHLSIATDSTLEAALRLLRKGARIDEAKDILRSRPDRSELIARLKSSQRLKFEELGKYIVAQTQVSSFQASVARMLLDIGADLGIAFGEHEDESRISVRATQRFFRETGIDLGVVLSNIAKERGIIGGGHSTAASLSGKAPEKELTDKIISSVKERLP